MNCNQRKYFRIIILLMLILSSFYSANADELKIDNNQKYIGIYSSSDAAISSLGTSINTLGWFDNLYSGPTEKYLSLCLDQHRYTAFITLQPKVSKSNDSKPNRNVMKQIAAGKYDELIISYLKELSKGDRINTELFIRFAHEMEPQYPTWYQWQTEDYKSYVSGFRHVVNLGRKYAPNVKWVWSPNRMLKTTKKWYPGDKYVDYVSVTVNTRQLKKITYSTFKKFYTKTKGSSILESYGKPIIFAEVAVTMNNDKARNTYINSIFDFVQNYDNCIGFIAFDIDSISTVSGVSWPYNFTNNATLKETFANRARDMLFDVILPPYIEEVAERAFKGNTFSTVYLSDEITAINSEAFANCKNLKRVRIPLSVQSIADDAFSGVDDLSIYGVSNSEAEVYAVKNGISFFEEYP